MAQLTRKTRAPKFQAKRVAPDLDTEQRALDDALPEDDATDTASKNERQVEEAVASIIGRLSRLADEQVRLKSAIEQRWLDNLRRYHSRYDRPTETHLNSAAQKHKSKLFANITRPKTVAWEARLSDLLFPTDDKNWGIEPTPVPELTDRAKQSSKLAKQAAQQASEMHQAGDEAGGQQMAAQGNVIASKGKEIDEQLEEAQRRCDLMSAELEDQLDECQYNLRCRSVIHDLCKLGTGVMKGPVATAPKRRAWEKVRDGQTTGPDGKPSAAVYRLGMVPDGRPSYQRTNPWHFFPDMSATRIEDAEFTFERHLCNPKQFRRLGREMSFNPDAARELLLEAPREGMPNYINELREITQTMQPVNDGRYHVWEYRGNLERDDVQSIGDAVGKDVTKILDEDPFREINVVVWFCNNRLLQFSLGPMDSGEPIYSVPVFEPDDTSMFGFGVPDLAADAQAAKNAAWRMTIDNAALSTGPQIVIDKDAITPPAGDDWTLRSMKVWLTSTTSLTKLPEGYKPFQTFDIPSHQDKLAAIIEMADQFCDEETFMPRIAEGDQGSHVQATQTVSMLMNSANVVFRRVVKNFDDLLTTPNLRRLYDWNMQFSPRDDIKGDYEVKARGSSVLIVRELQLQNLNQMLTNFSAHPVIGPMGKWAAAFRKYVQAAHISEKEIVKSDDVIEQEAKERAAQAAQAAAAQGKAGKSPEEMAHEKELAQMENATKVQVAEIAAHTAMSKIAQDSNISLDDLKTKVDMQQQDHVHKERVVAAEAALAAHSAATQPKDIGGSEF